MAGSPGGRPITPTSVSFAGFRKSDEVIRLLHKATWLLLAGVEAR
jgi:hypothetical protein